VPKSAQGEVVEPVNFNANGQTVIAGHKAAVERAMDACKARGAKMAKALPVSAPFHSSLIRPAADKLAARLAELTLNAPSIPVINNVDVSIENDPPASRMRWFVRLTIRCAGLRPFRRWLPWALPR
jgi:[acyl-carrier-protein] S-malonyltransferase